MRVDVHPLPAWARNKRFRPCHPPIFPDGEPTRDEVELALALFDELDPESQAWYGGDRFLRDTLRKLGIDARPFQPPMPATKDLKCPQ